MTEHSNEAPIIHAHARAGDPSSFVLDHVGKLQYLTDKVKLHEDKLEAGDLVMKDLIKKLTDINSNMAAVKWAVIGCALMLVINQFGLVATLKMWLKL